MGDAEMQRDLGRLEGRMDGIEETLRGQGLKIDALTEKVDALTVAVIDHRSTWKGGAIVGKLVTSAVGGLIVLAAEWLRRTH